MNLKSISDKELLNKTQILVQKERGIITDILNHLSEIQRRRLYSDLGCPSLFAYCTVILKYSESQAQRRIVAMRMINEMPEVESKISSGELSLTNIAQAKTYFNQEEKHSPLSLHEKHKVLEALQNRSSREGEKILLAKLSIPPKPVVEKMRQVTSEMTEIKFGADEKLLAKMNRIRGLMAHRKNNLGISELINELCEIALNELDPLRKEAKVERKKMPKNPPLAPKVNSRPHIPVTTKRQVWGESKGKCGICQSEYALEIDHRQPLVMGGSSEVNNLRLLCRSCNQRAAVTKLGRDVMMNYIT